MLRDKPGQHARARRGRGAKEQPRGCPQSRGRVALVSTECEPPGIRLLISFSSVRIPAECLQAGPSRLGQCADGRGRWYGRSSAEERTVRLQASRPPSWARRGDRGCRGNGHTERGAVRLRRQTRAEAAVRF